MNGILPAPATVSVFLLTYLIHSSLAFLLTCLVLRFGGLRKPELRVLVWKATLVVPVLTALSVSLVGLPHFGFQFVVAEGATAEPPVDDRGAPQVGRPDRSATSAAPVSTNLTADDNRGTGLQDALGQVKLFFADVAALGRLSHDSFAWRVIVVAWGVGVVVGGVRLGLQAAGLRRLQQRAIVIANASLNAFVTQLCRTAGIRRHVAVFHSRDCRGPMTARIVRPFILVPSSFLSVLSLPEQRALLAHELAHVALRDTLWNLIGQVICRILFFQRVNRVICRRLQIEMEFVADQHAGRMLDERSDLARCLTRLADWLAVTPQPPRAIDGLAASMAAFHSILGQRVELLLATDAEPHQTSRLARITALTLIAAAALSTIGFVPRAVAHSPQSSLTERTGNMTRPATTLALLAGLALPAAADDDKQTQESPARPAAARTIPEEPPQGLKGFNGVLVGRLVAKDIENGAFVVTIDAVSGVAPRNKAEKPKSAIGKTLAVDGVSGQALDRLLLMNPGDTLLFTAIHDRSDRLRFGGEGLHKMDPVKPEDYPELPEEFRGFQGVLAGRVVKKKLDTWQLIVRVDEVRETSEQRRAENPASIVGKPVLLGGFYQHRNDYQKLKAGDSIECAVRHAQTLNDHLDITKFTRKGGDVSNPPDAPRQPAAAKTTPDDLPDGIKGYNGMLIGRLAAKDIENGSFLVTIDAIPFVAPRSQAPNPRQAVGKTLAVDGLSGQFLDRLLLINPGDTLYFGAIHDRGNKLRFGGEGFQKARPVTPEDYPELTEEFRGFQGVILGKVVRKNLDTYAMIVRVDSIKETSEKSQARNPASIIGKLAIVAGLGRHRELYRQLNIGDTIECGIQHGQKTADHLTVTDLLKVVNARPGGGDRK